METHRHTHTHTKKASKLIPIHLFLQQINGLSPSKCICKCFPLEIYDLVATRKNDYTLSTYDSITSLSVSNDRSTAHYK